VAGSIVRILVVDDFLPWHRFVASMLKDEPRLRIVGEASDGLDAVQKARELQPDLVVLDIGLPKVNGIEVARRIRQVSPKSKILFLSENRSWDIAEEALRTGAGGYVVKSDAQRELLSAVQAVLNGKLFTSASMADNEFSDRERQTSVKHTSVRVVLPFQPQNVRVPRRHEVGFYSYDQPLFDDLTQFIGTALKTGNAAIVLATESHRDILLQRLQPYGLDIAAAIEEGRYIALDAADALATFMLRDIPEPVRFLKVLGELISTAATAVRPNRGRVSIFGEMCHLLWAQGNGEAAIQVEKLGNQLAKTHDIDILCGYSLNGVQTAIDKSIFERICAEHSAVRSP